MILTPIVQLQQAVDAVCPNLGVYVGDPANKATWKVNFAPAATNAQKTAAATAITNFDYPGTLAAYNTALSGVSTDLTSVKALTLVKQLMGSTPAQIDTFLAGANGIADANTRAIMAVVLKILAVQLRSDFS
jgi:hypothetical protein